MSELITCTPKRLPRDLWVPAAKAASEINPLNHPPINRLMLVHKGFSPTPMSIAVMTKKFWGNKGVKLTVGFLDNPSATLRSKILSHMNAWSKTANVQFVQSNTNPKVRIAREADGYWSYLGTDILSIPANEATMNLEAFTLNTPDSEFHRVVRHETGHTLGCPHEHMRAELVKLIDPKKAIAFFGQTQGWDPAMVKAQVLTPIQASSLLGTPLADQESIMCYQIPGTITKSGKPIVGGLDIDKSDFAFMGTIYPKLSSSKAKGKGKTKKKTSAKSSRKTAKKR
ncbi:MAG TPA: M12 family metallopeptidase [Pyrinomonadaceae bacterium]|jgi:hypothetical protein